MSDKHIFAIHTQQLPSLQTLEVGKSLLLPDPELWHRIINVLHLREAEEFIVFDHEKKLHLTLIACPKKGIIAGLINSVQTIAPIKPELHLFQGILKREAFNDVIYLAAQMGASSITPLITKKVQRTWGGQKEMDRLQKVMIAACEQAKQFTIPTINNPVEWAELSLPSSSHQTFSLFCQPSGSPFFESLQKIAKNSYNDINIFIGPEGGFTQHEEERLHSAQIVPCALTQSILRSQEAVAVSIGAIRCVGR